MAKSKNESLSKAVTKEIQSKFDLNKYKTNKGLEGNIKFKEHEWIPFSEALQDTLSIPGVLKGAITLVRGRSDTGKTTTAIEVAVASQKMGILPIIIITEMKHSWEYWRNMGFQMKEIFDEKGEVIDYEGFFIYRDRSNINSIEDVSAFILDMLDDQKKENLPYDLIFIWDSVGSIPCNQSIEKKNNNPMWNAGAITTQFGNFVNQKIMVSRKETSKYTNTFFIVNKTGVKPPEGPMSKPKMTNKGGDTFYWDASLVITFGNITNSGTSRLQAVRNKKKIDYALRTKVAISKNHINGVATSGIIISTAHGFIKNKKKDIDNYKKKYSSEWEKILGKGKYTIEEDDSEWEENKGVNISVNDLLESL